MYQVKYSLLNGVTSWRVFRIRLLSLRRDDHSGVLIGQRACWLMT